jgi:hypothetical protein
MMPRTSHYFKIHIVEAEQLSREGADQVMVMCPGGDWEMQERVKCKGIVTWEPVDVRAKIQMKSLPKMEIKGVAQQAYEAHIGDKWVTFAALYLPIVQQGQASAGYTEPLWGFWRERPNGA